MKSIEQSRPITPQDASKAKLGRIPAFVINIINEMIIENLSENGVTVVDQGALVDRIVTAASEHDTLKDIITCREDVFKRKWLDVEQLYADAGWVVGYNKPSIGDSFPAHFTFSPKQERT